MADIGVFIKQRREKAGYSLKKLASLSGISDSELFKIENGTRQNPNWKNRNRQPNPAPPKNKMSRDQPRLKSRIRFITMNCSELL